MLFSGHESKCVYCNLGLNPNLNSYFLKVWDPASHGFHQQQMIHFCNSVIPCNDTSVLWYIFLQFKKINLFCIWKGFKIPYEILLLNNYTIIRMTCVMSLRKIIGILLSLLKSNYLSFNIVSLWYINIFARSAYW